ncbi:MAG: AAA family ATPase [bacterium]
MRTRKSDTVEQLKALGLSTDLVFTAYAVFGRQAVESITKDPYSLIAESDGDVNWKDLDQFARRQGTAPENLNRVSAGILCALKRAAGAGHVYYPKIPLLTESGCLLGIEDLALLQKGLEDLCQRGLAFQEIPLDKEEARGDWIYLMDLHRAESGIAYYLGLLAHSPSKARLKLPEDIDFQAVEERLGISLAEAQREAIRLSLVDKVLVITGGPGTGKTTILKATTSLWSMRGARIKLAAPTGRASKRLSESTGRDASTIHRLLEYNPDQNRFNRNGYRPLKADLMIVDEASMIDTRLMAALLEALPPSAHLILVGDVDQLPPVGAGLVLSDIIWSGLVSVVHLTEIFRQRPGSLISLNAARINRGEFPILDSGGVEEGQDFFFIRKSSAEATLDAVLEMVTERIPEQFGLSPVDSIQVLVPMIKGEVGVQNLNAALQARLNPNHEGIGQFGYRISPGDKVMQIRNDYDKDVFNGDIGSVDSVQEDPVEVVVRYGDKETCYDHRDLADITLAYAVTVHKSQGSEYPAVVIPLVTQHYRLLQRNVLYTAVSRGQQLVVLVGTKRAIDLAIANNEIRKRYTGLPWRLSQTWEKRRQTH